MGERRGVLVIRHEAGAADTAARLDALGWQPVIAPMFHVEHIVTEIPEAGAIQAVLVTSANAPAALPATLHGVRLLAVGEATAAAARTSGFTDVASADGDAPALAALAGAVCDPAGPPLLLASGAGQGAPLEADLRTRGFGVVHRFVYAVAAVPALPAAARAALEQDRLAAALFFSPASARLFVGTFGAAFQAHVVTRVDALAISAATAQACAPLPWQRIRVASRPNQDELLALLR